MFQVYTHKNVINERKEKENEKKRKENRSEVKLFAWQLLPFPLNDAFKDAEAFWAVGPLLPYDMLSNSLT